MRALPVINYNPTKGVKSDFSALLKRFVETNTVRYEQFAEIWREMKMSLIFGGRQNDEEVREFTEECMNLAVSYLLPPNEFQVQIGGLYILYALYFKQLFEPKVKIRISHTQWQHLQILISEIHNQNHYDVEYIYCKLHHNNAFHFVANSQFQSLLSRNSIEEDDRATNKTQDAQMEIEQLQHSRNLLSEMMEGDAIDQLSGIHDQYHRVKCALTGTGAKQPQASLNMIQPSLVQQITKKITSFEWWKKNRAGRRGSRKRHDSGPTTSESEAESDSEKSTYSPKRSRSMGSVRAEIKERAMGASTSISRSRRHRQVKFASAESSSLAKPKTKKRDHLVSSDEEYGSASMSQTETGTLESEHTGGSNDGLCSMPAFRHLEESKGKKKGRRKKQDKPKAPGKPAKAQSKKKKKNVKQESIDQGNQSLNEEPDEIAADDPTINSKKNKSSAPRSKKKKIEESSDLSTLPLSSLDDVPISLPEVEVSLPSTEKKEKKAKKRQSKTAIKMENMLYEGHSLDEETPKSKRKKESSTQDEDVVVPPDPDPDCDNDSE